MFKVLARTRVNKIGDPPEVPILVGKVSEDTIIEAKDIIGMLAGSDGSDRNIWDPIAALQVRIEGMEGYIGVSQLHPTLPVSEVMEILHRIFPDSDIATPIQWLQQEASHS